MADQKELTNILNNVSTPTSTFKKFFKRGILPLIILFITNCIFSLIYLVVCNDPEDWNGMDEEDDSIFKNLFNRLYFSMTTLSTVGYGDISPKSTKARTLVMFHFSFIILESIGIVLGI